MKKSILNLGTVLNKREQTQINGGSSCDPGLGQIGCPCNDDSDCNNMIGNPFADWACIQGYCVDV